MFDLIKLPADIIQMMPVYKFISSKGKLEDVKAPTGANTEDMPAAQAILTLFTKFEDVLESYAQLIDYDGERLMKTVKAFEETDK